MQDLICKDRLLIGLGQALAGDVVANMIVFDEDKLFIPVETSTVTVVSKVWRQRTCVYQKSFDVKNHLSLSRRYECIGRR